MTDSNAWAQEQLVVDQAYQRRDEYISEIELSCAEIPPADTVNAARIASRRQRLSELHHAEAGLVFGRLDGLDGSIRHLGRVGIPGVSDDAEPVVLDWRARAARAFYTATPLDPQGQRLRRHIRLEGHRVVAVDDEPLDEAASSSELVGEGALLSALSERRTGKMGTAVATLQREQDDIVRAPANGLLVVQGGPGTGKTVVALHRVAYLLFNEPGLASQGVLVLGPSRRFLDYIAQVLPALGETAVVAATCDTLLPGISIEREEDRDVAELKGRAQWQQSLTKYVRASIPQPRSLDFVIDGDRLIIPASDVRRALESAASGRDIRQARRWFFEAMGEHIIDAYVQHHDELAASMEEGFEDILERVDSNLERWDNRAQANGASSSEVDGTLSDDDIEDLRERMTADQAVTTVLTDFWPAHDALTLLRKLLSDPVLLEEFAPWLTCTERDLIIGEPAEITSSDIALLDAVADALGSEQPQQTEQREFLAQRAAAHRDWSYGHVVVDEAQELSTMQWHMVARRVSSRSVTAVGDIDQTEAPHAHTTWAQAITPVFGQRWQQAELTICYRTPREVMALTTTILDQAGSRNRPPRSVRDSGIAPWQVRCTIDELGITVSGLVEQMTARWEGGTVGVIASTAVHDQLHREYPNLHVLSVTQSKGLEWDATLVVDPEGITSEPRGWNALYVALTRCTQELGQVLILR